MRWNDRCPACVNCGSDANDRRSRGYCAKCFPDAERLRKIERWDAIDSTTWVGCSYRGWSDVGMSAQEYIARCQGILRRNLKHRVHVESVRRGEKAISGLALEYIFDQLGVAAGGRTHRGLFEGWATTLEHSFSEAQRGLLYCIVDKIFCDLPPRSMWTSPLHQRITEQIRRNALQSNGGPTN